MSRVNNGDHICLKVTAENGNEVFYRISRSIQLKKLIISYCDRQSTDPNSIAFLFNGCRLQVDRTPRELKMKNGAAIDAMLHLRTYVSSTVWFSSVCCRNTS